MVLQALQTVTLVERFGYFLSVMSMSRGKAKIVGTDEDAEMLGRCPSSVRSTMQVWPFCDVIIVR